MAMTKFVRNVEDLSDDGGFKFRFKCDRCGDGFESTYQSAKTNMLKTAIDMFQVFSPLGSRLGNTAQDIDRGLRGKEHDAAFEKSVSEAMAFFRKCAGCGNWVCPENCWNQAAGLCSVCAPDASQQAAKEANRLAGEKAASAADHGAPVSAVSCLACGSPVHGGKFCPECGAAVQTKRFCTGCGQTLEPTMKFCANCGTPINL